MYHALIISNSMDDSGVHYLTLVQYENWLLVVGLVKLLVVGLVANLIFYIGIVPSKCRKNGMKIY